ncbi:MAG: putative zinc-binding peptidase [Cyclobacteriaceae bacterium]
MKVFQCGYCHNPLFFESYECDNCGHLSGYRDSDRMMLTFDRDANQLISDREKIAYKYCKNHEHDVCNWLIEKESDDKYCRACQLNRTIPNLSDGKNFEYWQNLEVAKHRLIYQLQKMGFDLQSKLRNEQGLCFDFIAKQNDPKIMTGHANGVITILLREADSATREKIKQDLHEPYRTLIGHLRHEVGHYFWDHLIYRDAANLKSFREIFGNEEQNYAEALATYYKKGAPDKWEAGFISKYATSHPWEDWAESWAHYLHLMDMVETSYYFGLMVTPANEHMGMLSMDPINPYSVDDFSLIVKNAIPLSFAVNSINRAMGLPDVYPFEVNENITAKMSFIHDLVKNQYLSTPSTT